MHPNVEPGTNECIYQPELTRWVSFIDRVAIHICVYLSALFSMHHLNHMPILFRNFDPKHTTELIWWQIPSYNPDIAQQNNPEGFLPFNRFLPVYRNKYCFSNLLCGLFVWNNPLFWDVRRAIHLNNLIFRELLLRRDKRRRK
ncbi:hypothethical protein [Ralstonia solanacearum PSI07]|nr:hypothethical protein [Ralstonia solanacearum PSI07]